MNDTSPRLFYGLPISSEFDRAFAEIPAELKSIYFDKKNPDYLTEISYEDCRYIGKWLPDPIDLPTLSLNQHHIQSLLLRLMPHHPVAKESLVIIPTFKKDI